VTFIRSLPEAEEVRTRLDVNSESVMDKSALNDDQQELSESSGLNFCYHTLATCALILLSFLFL